MPQTSVSEKDTGLSLKDYLRRREKISLTLWRKLKTSGTIFINDRLCINPALYKVMTGDEIRWELPETSHIPAEPLPLTIAYEDDYLLAIDKPSGQLAHPTAQTHSGTLANAVMQHYHSIGLRAAYHPIHRLDKDTSGLILIAKLPHIQNLFSFQTTQKTLQRIYLALTSHTPNPPAGCISLPIGRKPGSIIERTVTPDGKPAITLYQTISQRPHCTLLKLQLQTGRTHQIRVHLAACGMPLLGDDLYGGSCRLMQRQALHAAQLTFIHPITNEPIKLTAKLPDDMRQLLTKRP